MRVCCGWGAMKGFTQRRVPGPFSSHLKRPGTHASWFQVQRKMDRHALKMPLRAQFSVEPFLVGLEMAKHPCLLVSRSRHFVAPMLKDRLWSLHPRFVFS